MTVKGLNLGIVTISTGSEPIPVTITSGKSIYVLGRNGTGKSALVHNIVSQLPSAIYIPGSRPSYFESDSLQLTPATRRSMEPNWVSWDRQPTTRYRPINGTQRNERAILDLQSAETQFKVDAANEIKNLGGNAPAILRLQSDSSAFDRVNRLMRQSNINTQIIMFQGEMMATRDGKPYSIAKMSDGERAALIICAEVISAPVGSIFVIDEPELHLHRSIVSPLISSILKERPDCGFIVSTHELDLPNNENDGVIVLVRGCSWSGDHANRWDVDLISLLNGIPEDLRTDLLGSRRKILFVEGTENSLDGPLYSLLFPNISVRPKGTSRDVRLAVKALRQIEGLHHAKAFGIVDNDDMSDEHIEALEAEGVYALAISAVESLYYAPESLDAVAAFQAIALGLEKNDLINALQAAAIAGLSDDALVHLASRVAELKLRDQILKMIPSRNEISSGEVEQVNININSNFQDELIKLRGFHSNKDLESIISKYPIKYSPLPSIIANSLRFLDKWDYEKAVLARLSSDTNFRNNISKRLGRLVPQLH